MAKVMVVDDEKSICQAIGQIVRQAGYGFCAANDGASALALFQAEHPDIVILDVLLPDTSGYDVCRSIRAVNQDVPIIFLSAKGDIVDKGSGFQAGADDYLVKPFDPQELRFRLEALLRRAARGSSAATGAPDVLRVGDVEVSLARRAVCVRGSEVDFTTREFDLLAFLMAHPGTVFTREQLLCDIWNEEFDGYANNITVLVRRVREKIEEDPAKPRLLQTVWGVGYRFAG